MKCNIKQHKPLTPYQQKKYEAELGFRTFQYVLALTAMALVSQGATKVQIQSVINSILNQYDCLAAGTITMADMLQYLEEYGISLKGDAIEARETEYDNQIELIKISK